MGRHGQISLTMNLENASAAQQLARIVSAHQKHSTGHSPKGVSVVLSDDTLVITMHEALTIAERALALSAEGAAKVQEYHRQLFASSNATLWREIRRITGRKVREAAAEVEPATGAIVHAFTTGTVVQVFLLAGDPDASSNGEGPPASSGKSLPG